MRVTIRGEVVAFRDGQYKQIVIRNEEELENSWYRYTMMTICPNWQGILPKIGSRGFFEFEEANAGDKYYNRETGTEDTYNYSDNYFISYVEEPHVIENQKEFKF